MMKRAVILFLFGITLISCVEAAEDFIYDNLVNAIDKASEEDEPAYDTFLRVENNSNFTINYFEIGFDDSGTVTMNSILPDEIYSYTGFHQISDAPYILFTANNVEYMCDFKDPTNYFATGYFVIKIDIISVQGQTFSFKIEQE